MADRGGECETAAAKSPPHDLSVQFEFPCGCLPWCRRDLAAAQGMGFADFLRRHFGVLLSHARQTALFLVVPCILEAGGLPIAAHWKVYLPVMGFAFVTMVSAFIAAEKRGKMNAVTIRAVGLILIGQLLLGESPHMLWFQANARCPGGGRNR